MPDSHYVKARKHYAEAARLAGLVAETVQRAEIERNPERRMEILQDLLGYHLSEGVEVRRCIAQARQARREAVAK